MLSKLFSNFNPFHKEFFMKKLSIILILITCSSIFAQYNQESLEVKQAVYAYYNNHEQVIPIVQRMFDMDYLEIDCINCVNPTVRFKSRYLACIKTTNEEHKRIMYRILVYYIITKSNGKFPLKTVHFRIGTPIGNPVADYSALSDKVYFYISRKETPMTEPKLRFGVAGSASKLITRLEYDNQVIIYNKGIFIRNTLWDAWDDQMKDDMTFLLAFAWGCRFKDYSYNTNIKVLPSVDKGITPKNIKDLPITRTYKRPPSDIEFEDYNEQVKDRFFDFSDASTYLVQGEKDRVSILIEQKKLVVNHSKRTVYIHPEAWYNLSKEQQEILSAIIAIKMGNECRDNNYKISVNDYYNRDKVLASNF